MSEGRAASPSSGDETKLVAKTPDTYLKKLSALHQPANSTYISHIRYKTAILVYMNTYNWYSQLSKPTWSPPSWLFGPVWSVLYIIIAISFGTVFYKIFSKEIPLSVGIPFALNLIFNAVFTPIQFGLKNNLLAAIDILLVVGTLVWALYSIWHSSPELKWIVYVNLPYLVWGLFATCLQLTITYLNR